MGQDCTASNLQLSAPCVHVDALTRMRGAMLLTLLYGLQQLGLFRGYLLHNLRSAANIGRVGKTFQQAINEDAVVI